MWFFSTGCRIVALLASAVCSLVNTIYILNTCNVHVDYISINLLVLEGLWQRWGWLWLTVRRRTLTAEFLGSTPWLEPDVTFNSWSVTSTSFLLSNPTQCSLSVYSPVLISRIISHLPLSSQTSFFKKLGTYNVSKVKYNTFL